MEKTITVDGKQIRFKANGSTPLRYKAQFGRDYFKEILKMSPLQKIAAKKKKEIDIKDLESLDFEVFYNLTWVMAKTANPDIAEPITFFDQFEEFPLLDILPALQELIIASLQQSKKKL